MEFIDYNINQLSDQLLNNIPRLCAQYLLPHFLPQLTADMWLKIKAEYYPFLQNVDINTVFDATGTRHLMFLLDSDS
jgi:hypothetical protein